MGFFPTRGLTTCDNVGVSEVKKQRLVAVQEADSIKDWLHVSDKPQFPSTSTCSYFPGCLSFYSWGIRILQINILPLELE